MLIGLCGFKRAGKDTVARGLVEDHRFVKVAFADALRREVAILDGIEMVPDAEKDITAAGGFSYRDALIKRGQARRDQDPDYWVKHLAYTVAALPPQADVVVSDCRFRNELAWIRGRGGLLVWVWRDGVVSNGHITERDLSAACDFRLHNDMRDAGSLAAEVLSRVSRPLVEPVSA